MKLGRAWLLMGFVSVAVAVWIFVGSPNDNLWIVCVAALLASVLIIGGQQVHPVLLWVVGFNWLGIAADILAADIAGEALGETLLGPYRVQAFNYLLWSLLAFSIGIRCGTLTGKKLFRNPVNPPTEQAAISVSVQQAVVAYIASLLAFRGLEYLASTTPSLQQPIVALFALKYIWIYLIAATVFKANRNYAWLAFVIVIEFVVGITSFFGTYKEAVFVTLIALMASGRRLTPLAWAVGAALMVFVVWASLFWTSIKPDYRYWVSGYTNEQVIVRSFGERAIWITDRFMNEPVDYDRATQDMVMRAGNTVLFALLLSRQEAGFTFDVPSRYLAGLEHVLMPRLLFPDKAALDDSRLTAEFTGRRISENTSISIGYIAEALYDFQFPMMLLPISGIGLLLGLTAIFYLTRPVPPVIREAFMCANLFLTFNFGQNIDKALGIFFIGLVVLSLLLKIGYPWFAAWLAGISPAQGSARLDRPRP
jgi:hypothetical protein